MIIINADDWGRSRNETDAALLCYKTGRITSVSAMVFMEDSYRAAKLAKDLGIEVGLHLNFDQRFTRNIRGELLERYHNRIASYLKFNRYNFLIYNPFLKKQFQYVYKAQVKEFLHLYGKQPSHINGHHHLHLCSNMLIDKIIPSKERVRRNFSFFPGEKIIFSRIYRCLIDRWLARRYILTDYFFALSQYLTANRFIRILEISKIKTIEVMTHPFVREEYNFLMSDDYLSMMSKIEKGSYLSMIKFQVHKNKYVI